MTTDYATLIEAHRADFFADLAKVLQVPSVKSEPTDHAPYGEGPRQVLNVAQELANGYGFRTRIVDDAALVVEWGPESDDYLGVFGHLDVVPAGDGWSFPPFDLSEKDGRLFGRGVLDNKGPAWSVLYGMKLLKDSGYTPTKSLRIVLGSDEENGSADMRRYLAQEPAPSFGFTPDCKWPAVYGERGIVNYTVDTPMPADLLAKLSDFTGDQARDHVSDDLSVSYDGKLFHATGKRVPTNAPEMGVNALTELAKQVNADGSLPKALADYFKWLEAALADKHYGEGLGLSFEDEDSGKLIMTPYQLEKTATGLQLSLAMRYPVTCTEAWVTEHLEQAVPAGSTVTVIRSMPGTLHDKNDPRIKGLSVAYADISGLDGTPVTTTGATYARQVPNIIAFGPSFPGQKGIAHKEDEWMDVKDLLMNMNIYMNALQVLGE